MAATDHPFYDNLITIITDMIADITVAQTAYFATHGHYFQGIKTPTTQQDGASLGDTIDETAKPTDQLEDWVTFAPQTFKKNSKIPYQVSVDVYEAPSGHGWIFTGKLWYNSEHLVYMHHVGPEIQEGIFDELYIQVDEVI